MFCFYFSKIKKTKNENAQLKESVEGLNAKIADITSRITRAKYVEGFKKHL